MTLDEVIHECEHLSDEFDYENMNGNMAYSTYSDFKDSISKIQKWLEENRWIPVSERLPEYGGYVLAVFEKCLPFVAMYYSGVKKFSCEEEEANPTHWMPLPEPPQEVE